MFLTMTQDKTGTFAIALTQGDPAVPLPIVTGMTVWFHAAYNGLTIDKSSPSSGITIVDAPTGQVVLQIEPADTAALGLDSASTVGIPCELTLQVLSEAYEIDRGVLSVSGNVGTP